MPIYQGLAKAITAQPRPAWAPEIVTASQRQAATQAANRAALAAEDGLTIAKDSADLASQFADRAYATQRARALYTAEQIASGNGADFATGAGSALEEVGAAGRIANDVSRIPGIGPALAESVPALAEFGSVAGPVGLILAIPAALSLFQKPVVDWLSGGWHGQGQQGKEESKPGILLHGGQCHVQYNIAYSLNYSPGDGEAGSTQALGPIDNIGRMTPPGMPDGFYVERAPTTPGGDPIYQAIFQQFNFYPHATLSNLQLSRVDGQPDNCGDSLDPDPSHNTTSFTPSDVAKNPNPFIPDSLTAQKTIDQAKIAALAAIAATIAAGKTALIPKNPYDISQDQDKKAGEPDTSPGGQTEPGTQPETSACEAGSCGAENLSATKDNAKALKDLSDLLQGLGIGDLIKKVNGIDEKLGEQMLDSYGNNVGISYYLGQAWDNINRLGDWLRLDRVTNLLTLAVTVHNASMLSNALVATLEAAIGNVLNVLQIKDSKGNSYDIHQIVDKSVEELLKSILGDDVYGEANHDWKAANKIFQAGANIINNLQNIRFSIVNALNLIGEMNGKVANALKRYGVVGAGAYQWFNPTPNYDNAFIAQITDATLFVSNLDSITSSILSAQQSVDQITTQGTELTKAITDGTENPGLENTQAKTKDTQSKTVSVSPPISVDDLIPPDF